ncbi:MAG: crotonase/enoyl-CoA hydratase family protein [Bacteroidia bacterium]|nr:crotonase/enoyl-CoA hydratase family protein [Bacteroidia bacterium]
MYQTFEVTIQNHIAHVQFNRPEKANALNQQAWDEMKTLFEAADADPEVRVIVLSGAGKHFCAGIDLALLMDVGRISGANCEGRKREKLLQIIQGLQNSVSALEKCRKPVLAAIHNGCIGAGVDIIAACDMRYCTEETWFTIREIDMGMVADLGTLQRLPKIIPDGIAREMAFTGRKMKGAEALSVGLVNRAFPDSEKMIQGVMEIAAEIAAKSPLSIRGSKEMLNYTRDHSVAESLQYMAVWNAAMLLSDDLTKAFQASLTQKPPVFEN